MKAKPVQVTPQARRDIDEAIAWYLGQEAETAAQGFIDALEQAFTHIGRNPGTGSPRYAHELDLPGVRSWPVRRFPSLVFYFEHPGQVDVWRVLHGNRDIPAWLREAEVS